VCDIRARTLRLRRDSMTLFPTSGMPLLIRGTLLLRYLHGFGYSEHGLLKGWSEPLSVHERIFYYG
jgi:hypothetical protein